jgi:hypothetical protein
MEETHQQIHSATKQAWTVVQNYRSVQSVAKGKLDHRQQQTAMEESHQQIHSASKQARTAEQNYRSCHGVAKGNSDYHH